MADTGLGATVSFATATFTGHSFIEIGGGGEAIGGLDTTHLGTSGHATAIPEDVIQLDKITGRIQHVATGARGPAVDGAIDTLTITFPIHTSPNTTNATLAGTGWISKLGFPMMASNQVQEMDFEWTWDGGTGPTFTVESV